jgi:hypothetical protein
MSRGRGQKARHAIALDALIALWHVVEIWFLAWSAARFWRCKPGFRLGRGCSSLPEWVQAMAARPAERGKPGDVVHGPGRGFAAFGRIEVSTPVTTTGWAQTLTIIAKVGVRSRELLRLPYVEDCAKPVLQHPPCPSPPALNMGQDVLLSRRLAPIATRRVRLLKF